MEVVSWLGVCLLVLTIVSVQPYPQFLEKNTELTNILNQANRQGAVVGRTSDTPHECTNTEDQSTKQAGEDTAKPVENVQHVQGEDENHSGNNSEDTKAKLEGVEKIISKHSEEDDDDDDDSRESGIYSEYDSDESKDDSEDDSEDDSVYDSEDDSEDDSVYDSEDDSEDGSVYDSDESEEDSEDDSEDGSVYDSEDDSEDGSVYDSDESEEDSEDDSEDGSVYDSEDDSEDDSVYDSEDDSEDGSVYGSDESEEDSEDDSEDGSVYDSEESEEDSEDDSEDGSVYDSEESEENEDESEESEEESEDESKYESNYDDGDTEEEDADENNKEGEYDNDTDEAEAEHEEEDEDEEEEEEENEVFETRDEFGAGNTISKTDLLRSGERNSHKITYVRDTAAIKRQKQKQWSKSQLSEKHLNTAHNSPKKDKTKQHTTRNVVSPTGKPAGITQLTRDMKKTSPLQNRAEPFTERDSLTKDKTNLRDDPVSTKVQEEAKKPLGADDDVVRPRRTSLPRHRKPKTTLKPFVKRRTTTKKPKSMETIRSLDDKNTEHEEQNKFKTHTSIEKKQLENPKQTNHLKDTETMHQLGNKNNTEKRSDLQEEVLQTTQVEQPNEHDKENIHSIEQNYTVQQNNLNNSEQHTPPREQGYTATQYFCMGSDNQKVACCLGLLFRKEELPTPSANASQPEFCLALPRVQSSKVCARVVSIYRGSKNGICVCFNILDSDDERQFEHKSMCACYGETWPLPEGIVSTFSRIAHIMDVVDFLNQ